MSPNSDESGKQSLYPGSEPDRHQNLITCSLHGPLPTFSENFMQILSARQTDNQTDNDDYISSLMEVKKKLTTPSVRSCSNYTGYQSDNEWNLSSLCWSTRRSTTCRAPLYLSDDCQLVVTTGRRQLHMASRFHI